MNVPGEWPNIEEALLEYLGNEIPELEWRTELPQGWTPPMGLIEQIPGGGNGPDYDDRAVVDITLFHLTRPDVWDLVARVKPILFAMPGRGRVPIDDITASSSFGIIPYANPNVRRAVGTYRLTTRPQ